MKDQYDAFDLEVSITLRRVKVYQGQRQWTNEMLVVNEKAELPAMDFLEVSEILGQFHALSEKIRKAKSAD